MAQSLTLDKKAATASGSFPASIPLDAQERRVDQRQMRALRHAAGVRYFDFTPVLIIALASVIGARALVAIGAGDTEPDRFAGMQAAVVITLQIFLIWGRGRWMSGGRPIRHIVHRPPKSSERNRRGNSREQEGAGPGFFPPYRPSPITPTDVAMPSTRRTSATFRARSVARLALGKPGRYTGTDPHLESQLWRRPNPPWRR